MVFTDHAGITSLHETYLGQQKTTDVISFLYPPSPPAVPGFVGEVIVNVQCAKEVGPHHEGAVRELARYIAHGCQHLSGAEDHTPLLKKQMQQIEDAWLNTAEKNGLLSPLKLL